MTVSIKGRNKGIITEEKERRKKKSERKAKSERKKQKRL